MNELNFLLCFPGGFFMGYLISCTTEKRTGGHPPVLFVSLLCTGCFLLCHRRPVTDLVYCHCLILAGIIDHYSMEIPDRCSLIILLCALCHQPSVAGGLAMSWLIPVALMDWIGWGDVKMMICSGFYLGPGKVFSALILAFWSACGFELCKKNHRRQIPLAPWLASGCLISLFCGDFTFFLF